MPWPAPPLLFALAALLSFALTPLVLRLCARYKAFDLPDARKIHNRDIPRLGGAAIFGAISLALLAAVLWWVFTGRLPDSPLFPAIYVGLCGFFFIGFFDDLKSIPALPRLLAQVGVAALVVFLSGGALSIGSVLGRYILPDWLAWALTVLWIVGVVNTFNWIDGLDGLASGVAAISAAAFLALALLHPGLPNVLLMATLCSVLIGALAGFLPYNFFPARIFIGDGGAFTLGYLLAVISIAGLFKQAAVVSFAIPVAILALPIGDTAFAIIRRAIARKSITTPDNQHIHHRVLHLLRERYSERADGRGDGDAAFIHSLAHRNTVLWLYGLTALCAALAVLLGLRA